MPGTLDQRIARIQELSRLSGAAAPLLRLLEVETNPIVRYVLIDALGKKGNLQTLRRLLVLKDWERSQALQRVLERSVRQILDRLLDRLHGEALFRAFVFVLEWRPELIPLLRQRLEGSDIMPALRKRLNALLEVSRHYLEQQNIGWT